MEAAFQSGFASALLDVLFTKATEFVTGEAKKFLDSDNAFKDLEVTIVEAHDILKKVEPSEREGNVNIALHTRVVDLTILFYEAEDLMGDIVKLVKRSSKLKKLIKGRKIRPLQKKMSEILEELKRLKHLPNDQELAKGEPSNQSQHRSNILLVGRESDVKEIMDNLVSSSSSEFNGVAIVGMSGLGKTRLAQTISQKATAHFSVILWVDVTGGSFDYNETIQKLNVEASKSCGNNEVFSQGDTNVLIIFDNLVEVTLKWYDMVSEIRCSGINGKKYTNITYLITTYCPEVVRTTRTRSHYLRPLCVEDCERVIIETLKSISSNLLPTSNFLDEVIHTLAKNSGGLPSVARLLGQFLEKYGVDYVRNIVAEDLWGTDEFQRHIFPVLKPCYSEFKSHLKQYIAYFSLFPHDYDYAFTAEELVHLWMGEGFIEHPDGAPKMIEIGKNHFDELMGRSIFRRLSPMTQTETPTYKLNQHSQKLAQLAASKTYMRLPQGALASDINTCHLSLCYKSSCPLWDDIKKSKHLRTLFALINSNIGKIPPTTFKKLTRLRVLSLSGTIVDELPESIDRLKRLSYLNISNTPIKSLPKTLCKLKALQFLKIRKKIGTLESLPENFQDLTKMTFLDWGIDDIQKMGLPPHIGNLSTLQTLPLFPVGKKDGHHLKELKNMKDLQGSIRISKLENFQGDWAVARATELDQKLFRNVELQWDKSMIPGNAYELLSGLKPHENLKQLRIRKYCGHKFPEWMTHSLPELEEMHLHNCPFVQGLPMHGSLRSLKTLFLENVGNIGNVDPRFFGQGYFPKLESLEFKDMEQLETLTIGLELDAMPRLQVLTFFNCPKLITISSLESFSSLQKLEIERCGTLNSLPDLPSSLKTLKIKQSDLLNDCCKEGGEYWTTVDRVPNVEIDYQKILTSGSNSRVTTSFTNSVSTTPDQLLPPKSWKCNIFHIWYIFGIAIFSILIMYFVDKIHC